MELTTFMSEYETTPDEFVSLAEKKRIFLRNISSKNPDSMNRYKRVAESTIRYAGGKSLSVGHILELLPIDTKRVISPFFGVGSVEIAISKHPGLG